MSALYQISTRPIIPDMELAKLEPWLPYASIPFSQVFFTPGQGIGDGSFVMPQKFFVYLQFMVAVPSVGWAKESQFRQIDVEGQGLITLKQIELATSLNWALFLQLNWIVPRL